jgi:hypothetical protein
VRLLVEFGVWRSRAREAAERYGLTSQLVRRARDALAQEIEGGARFANPSAILLSRLEAGWDPPEVGEDKAPPAGAVGDGSGRPEGQLPTTKADRKPLLAIVDDQGRERDPYEWFAALKDELQLQLPRAAFDTWLRPAELVDYRPPDGDTAGVITIRLHNLYAHEWVKHRLHRVIQRLVDTMGPGSITVEYTGPHLEEPGEDDNRPSQQVA